MQANIKSAQPSVPPVWLAVSACFLVATVEGFDVQILSIAAPRFAPELGFDPAALGLIFSAVSFGIMIGSTVGGRAGDVFGHRSILIIAIAILGVFTLATPFCETFESFLVVRLLTGVGFGIALPNLIALAANVAAEGRAFQTNAAVFWGVPLGAVIAAALFSYGIGWRAVFIAGGVAAIICIPFVIFAFRAPHVRKEQQLGALEGVAVLLAQGYRMRSVLIWSIFMLAYIVSYFAAIWLPMIVSGKGFEPETAASVMLSYGLFGMLGVLVTGWACDRFSFQVPITLCWLLIVPVLIAAGFSEDWLSLHIIGGIIGFCISGGLFSLFSVAAAGYPPSLRGTGAGVALAWARVGAILGPLLGGGMLQAQVPMTWIMGLFAALALATALLVFLAGAVLRPASETGTEVAAPSAG